EPLGTVGSASCAGDFLPGGSECRSLFGHSHATGQARSQDGQVLREQDQRFSDAARSEDDSVRRRHEGSAGEFASVGYDGKVGLSIAVAVEIGFKSTQKTKRERVLGFMRRNEVSCPLAKL